MIWSSKKTEKLEVRLSAETKQAFLARCKIEGRSASEAVRSFIEDHLARPISPQELKMIARSPFTYAGLAAAVVAAVVVAGALPSRAEPDFAGAFKSIDRDGDGRLSRTEFGGSNASPASAAPAGSNAGGGTLRLSFTETDTNQDAAISLAEFTAYSRAAILNRFLALDANSDGRITLAEAERPGALLGPAQGAKADHPSGMAISGSVQRLFARADKNNDGSISPAEFGARP